MSAISNEDMMALAQLSSLQLGSEEAASLKNDLEAILGYVEALGQLNTDGIEPTYQVNAPVNVFREDVIDQAAPMREQLLALAPEALENQVKVPKVL